MLAKPVRAIPEGQWCFELKFNGYRALIIKSGEEIRLLSREKTDLGKRFPEIVTAVRTIKAEEAIIDGEIIAIDEQGRSSLPLLKAHDAEPKRTPILYYAFDLLELAGVDWKSRPLTERQKRLEKLIPKGGALRFSRCLGMDGGLLLKEVRKHGLTGLIGKRVDSLYEPGKRSGAWIQLK